MPLPQERKCEIKAKININAKKNINCQLDIIHSTYGKELQEVFWAKICGTELNYKKIFT